MSKTTTTPTLSDHTIYLVTYVDEKSLKTTKYFVVKNIIEIIKMIEPKGLIWNVERSPNEDGVIVRY